MDFLKETQKTISKRLEGYRVQVYLFGSQAEGKAGRTSDIDVAVLPLEPLPSGVLSSIREELEESCIPFPVDLVNASELGQAWVERIQKEGILWTD
ncbi:MAG: nucleotidyltransferase domain-containing protein [Thermodesulfobacteriota bacterium]|nr:nucleotidyltransferase domain-containing protein [Thermodesulfobacteriota bacterium]